MQRVGATLLQCLTGSDEDVKHQMGPYFTWKVKNVKECFLKNIVPQEGSSVRLSTCIADMMSYIQTQAGSASPSHRFFMAP